MIFYVINRHLFLFRPRVTTWYALSTCIVVEDNVRQPYPLTGHIQGLYSAILLDTGNIQSTILMEQETHSILIQIYGTGNLLYSILIQIYETGNVLYSLLIQIYGTGNILYSLLIQIYRTGNILYSILIQIYGTGNMLYSIL